jgi:hypothetical protein
LAVTVTVPERLAPFAGAVIETVGGVASGAPLFTVTVTLALVVEFPAASFAMAVNVCAPFEVVVVFQDVVYGVAVSSAPRLAPSSWNWTLATPTLSVALADTLTVPDTLAPLAGAVMEMVGGVVSGDAVLLTATLTDALVAELFDVSVAIAVSTWLPFERVVVFSEYA